MECITKRNEINIKRKDFIEALKKFIKFHPNQLMHLDKSDLEELLFETNYAIGYNRNTCGSRDFIIPGFTNFDDIKKFYRTDNDIKMHALIAKFPVWTGDFLKYIDLSEVDWSNVVWDPEVISEMDILWLYNMEDYHYVTKPVLIPEGLDSESQQENCIILNNTNANIDFSESFEAKLTDEFNIIQQCNFNGTDLSNSNTKSITGCGNCDLRNTNFKVNKNQFTAFSSDFRTIPLSDIKTTYMAGCIGSELYSCFFDNCNVADTGLYVYAFPEDSEGENFYYDIFVNNITKGYYNNCTINLDFNCLSLPSDYFDEDDDYDDGYDDDEDYGLGFKF